MLANYLYQMNRKGKVSLILLSLFVLLGAIFLFYQTAFVFAGSTILNTSAGGNSFQLNEDVNFVFNISINNTEVALNITQVNITFPGVFNYTAGTANASIATNFSNSSSIVLTFINASGLATENATLINFTSLQYFWFNASVHTPGNYNITVYTLYSNGTTINTNYTNFTVVVNDTTIPIITINLPAATNLSTSSANFNVTLNEAGSACNYTLNSGTTNYSMSNNGNTDFNGTNATIADGTYTVNYYCKDTAGNLNRSASRTFGIDATFPSNITFVDPTPVNNSNRSSSSTTFNITVVEVNIRTALLQIRTGGVDTSNYSMTCNTIGGSNYACNYTNSSIADGRYNYTVYANDTAGNLNNSALQGLFIDTVFPGLNITQPRNTTYTNNQSLSLNYSVSDANPLSACWYTLFNGTSGNLTANITLTCGVNTTINVSQGSFIVKVYANDSANNVNGTGAITFFVDTLAPTNFSFVDPSPAAGSNATSFNVNVTFTDINIGTALFQIVNATNTSSGNNYTMTCNALGGGNQACNYTNASIANGGYNYTIFVNDTSNNLNSTTTRLLGIEAGAAPFAISFVNPTAANYTNNSGSFVVNISVNKSGSLGVALVQIVNATNSSSGNNYTMTCFSFGTSQYACNYTNASMADTRYNYTVFINDSAGNFNNSGARGIIIDKTPPTKPTHPCTPQSVTQGQIVTCSCSGTTDILSGINVSYELSGYSFTSSPSTATTGSFNLTCTVQDYAGNQNTTNSNYNVTEITGSGSNTAGGGTGEEKKDNTFTKITPGAATIMRVDDYGVKEISIDVKNQANQVRIEVVKLTGQPASISQNIEGKVYKYVEIRATNLASLNKATIQIKVEKSWVTQNNLAKEKIVVYRYGSKENTWQELPTTFKNEDSTFYYFDAVTTNFSIFAIAEKKAAAPAPTPLPTPTPEPSSPAPTPTPEVMIPEEETSSIWIWLIVAVILIVLIAWIVIISIGQKNLKHKIWMPELR